MLIILLFSIFIIFASLFNLKLYKNKDDLGRLEHYKNVKWGRMYSDGIVQIEILKRISSGKTKIEKELQFLLGMSIVSFSCLFVYMIYFLQK